MIDYSRANVMEISKETGFLKDNVEKVLRLADILETLFSSKWGEKLVLKGGTAINMFYREMPRLSVDIDLDYIGKTREEMLEDKEKLQEYLKNQLFQKGYTLSEASKRYFALDSYMFHYVNNAENRDMIKVEINFLDRAHVLPIQNKRIDTLGLNGTVDINVLDKNELYGSKLAALIERSKPRDIYDIHGLVKDKESFNPVLLRKCFIFYNCIGGKADILNFDEKKLEIISKRDYDRMLKPMLSKNERFNHIEAVSEIKAYLNGLMRFTEHERTFIDKFIGKEYCPELLFDEGSIAVRIGWHPMAFWRCEKTDEKGIAEQKELLRCAVIMENRGEEQLQLMTDREIVVMAKRNNENGKLFTRLYNGGKAYEKQEDNDIALLKFLAEYSIDKEKLLRIFKTSGQYERIKTDEHYMSVIEQVLPKPNGNTATSPIVKKVVSKGVNSK